MKNIEEVEYSESSNKKIAMRVSIISIFVNIALSVFKILLLSTRDSAQSIRCTSWALDISRLKIATAAFSFRAAFWARFKAKAVLPIEGRAATKINLPCSDPDRYRTGRHVKNAVAVFVDSDRALHIARDVIKILSGKLMSHIHLL